VLQELIDAIAERQRRRQRLEAQLDRLAPDWDGYPLAQALQAFRGIQKTVAYTVVAETADLARFAHPARFMAWLGLVPGEHSSGSTRRQGPITRCGNRWARTLLVEAAWAYRYTPKVSRIIELRAQNIAPAIRQLAWQAQLRPHPQVPQDDRPWQAPQRRRHRGRTRARRIHLGRRPTASFGRLNPSRTCVATPDR